MTTQTAILLTDLFPTQLIGCKAGTQVEVIKTGIMRCGNTLELTRIKYTWFQFNEHRNFTALTHTCHVLSSKLHLNN